MRKLMTRAWEIAKEGQNKFGGKVSEYLSESMKMAWGEVKGNIDGKIALWKELSEQAGKNYDYGFAAWPAVETNKDLAIAYWKDSGAKDFKEWLENDILDSKKEIERKENSVKNYSVEARKAYDSFEESGDVDMDVRDFRRFANKIMSQVSEEKEEAYRTERSNKLKEIKSKRVVVSAKVGVTGPIYDEDSNPTYMDFTKGA